MSGGEESAHSQAAALAESINKKDSTPSAPPKEDVKEESLIPGKDFVDVKDKKFRAGIIIGIILVILIMLLLVYLGFHVGKMLGEHLDIKQSPFPNQEGAENREGAYDVRFFPLGMQREHLGMRKENLGMQREHLGMQREHLGMQREHLGMQREHLGMQREHLGMPSARNNIREHYGGNNSTQQETSVLLAANRGF